VPTVGPRYLGGGGVVGAGPSPGSDGRMTVGIVIGVSVCGGIGPAPSGSTVAGAGPVVDVGLVGLVGDVDVVSVGLGSVVVGVVVVVVGVVVVVLGRSCTLVRGTQVYSGSGTNPGGTTAVSGTAGAGGGGA
jgi:hypothetical protein